MGELLNFDLGVKTYTINNECEVSFNPTDSFFSEKMADIFIQMDEKQEAIKTALEESKNDPKRFYEFISEQDREIRALIDNLFDKPISDSIFGEVCTYAMADGLPVWCNFMFAILDEIDRASQKEQKAFNPRVEKYRKKYQRYQK